MSPKLVRATGLPVVPLVLAFLAPGVVHAQTTGSVRGRVTESGTPAGISDAQVSIVGTSLGAVTNATGDYTIVNVPAGARQVTIRRIGYQPRTVPVTVSAREVARVDFALVKAAAQLDQVVVTALGQSAEVRTLGAAQQTVSGAAIAQTQRENFVNALQGRVAGVVVNASSGVPGASTSITIRGVSSISSSNQPLFVIDGLPMDNKTTNTNVLGSDAPGSATAFNNRGVDFTNRAADVDPNDIESLTVLKGPEAAALYGIDASNGAIVITTKRGRAGTQQLQYSNRFSLSQVRSEPEIQRTYGPQVALGSTSFLYFGAPYADTTKFYDNIANFFQTGLQQSHNLSFSGGAADGRINYRVASALLRNEGVIRNSHYNRVNLTGSSNGQVTRWLNADLSMQYSNANNAQPYKGDNGPFVDLLLWPQTDNAEDYLTAAGTRRRLTTLSASSELDNPFFNIYKNINQTKNNRVIANLTLNVTPFSWGSLKTQLGSDSYTNQITLMRHPESAYGFTYTGILDQAADITRNLTSQTILTINPHGFFNHLWVSGLAGNTVYDNRSTVDALVGQNFLDPNFVSVNNTQNKSSRTTLTRYARVGVSAQATFDFNHYLYVNVTGHNDWTSTIPRERNSFFYPGVNGSFVFSDAFPSLKSFMTGRLRAAYANAGRDAQPYSYAASLESKTTSYGSYGYGFTGPNPGLKPEFKKEYELGTQLGFFNDRLGVDATVYRSQTKDQIVQNLRGSYGTGFILFNLNGASTRNQGLEIELRGTPVQTRQFSWDVLANFDKHHGKTLSLPNALPESYVSDTWLFGNVRNGTEPGLSTESLTGLYYLRNNAGQILIDPTTGLPLRSTTFIDAGYDRTPKWTVGLSNTLRYKRLSLDFLLDFRRGGDVFNATEQYLTARGLGMGTLDRNTPRIIPGVLRDGKENSTNPTPNSIVVIPAVQTSYYTNMSEELFIEKNINWMWLKDITLNVGLPTRVARNASLFVTVTDVFVITNYTGLDAMTNGNTAAVGGSGAVGIDWANFPTPRGLNFGLRLGF
ncbi:MAG: SusC/RagA family TonB-linked outer membrane protein [Gemmatirosa sp.]|nr:SusC/RagA family TonB-linked outer membrane protein [Gemmatirosa sp.]